MEHHDDEEEDEIEYEVCENVDDLFEGYSGGKIIVVAFEVTRKAFFRKDERNNDGALRKRGSTPRDPGGAKNNTVECAQYKKELEEAAEIERQLAERAAAEAAERERAVSARAERASRRERESVISARAERARKRAQETEGRRRSLRQRIR